jgi:methenyltetrahydromethanopterin cyclohydrolase
LHALKFDIRRVLSGFGNAPLAPVAHDDLTGIGRTNDAVLYGGEVTLWLRGDDESLRQFGPRIPSSSSSDHGRPFAQVFEHYNRDFYKIDPLLFSPAVVTLINVDTGNSFRYGVLRPDLLRESFGTR